MNANDPIVVHGLLAFLGLAAAVTIASVLRCRAGILRELRDVEGFLRAVRHEGRDSALARAVREHAVGFDPHEGKVVLSKPLPALRREYAEDEVAHHWSFWIGSLLTGVSLIITFILIALVMTNDVSGAIRESVSADDRASVHLSQAVSLLGGKFYISAAGVGGSVLALMVSNWARADICRHAEHPDVQMLGAFTSVEAQQLTAKLDELALHRADQATRAAQHGEVCAQLVTLNTRIEKLNSIEVSVKTMGNEVSANLKNLMKDAMGEQLAGMLRDTMADVSNIADRVQQSMTDAFGRQLQTLSAALQQSLATLREAIEGQSQGQLEKILSQLQNTVSGGFQNESAKMVAALEGFANVVPALELQLRTMTGRVAEETRQRSEDGTRMTQLLMDRVGALVESMSAQQSASAQAIDRIQEASTHGAEAMARRLEASGVDLVSNVLGSSRAQIEAIVGELQAAANATSSRYGHIEAQASNAAAAVAQASDGLTRSASAIIEVANHTSSLVAQAKAGSEAMRAASGDFMKAGNTLLGSVGQMQQVVDATRTQTSEQQQLLMLQREYTKEVEKLWPMLFDTYLAQFKRSADELGRSWADFHDKIANVANSVGADFAENTSILSDNVDRLVQLASPRRATP